MVTTSQVLVTVGLVLEGTATFLTIKKLFWGYSKRVMESAKFDYVREKEEKKEDCRNGSSSIECLHLNCVP